MFEVVAILAIVATLPAIAFLAIAIEIVAAIIEGNHTMTKWSRPILSNLRSRARRLGYEITKASDASVTGYCEYVLHRPLAHWEHMPMHSLDGIRVAIRDLEAAAGIDEFGIPYTATSATIDAIQHPSEPIDGSDSDPVSQPAEAPAVNSAQFRPVTVTINMRDGRDFEDVDCLVKYGATIPNVIEAACLQVRNSERFAFAEIDWDEITSFQIVGGMA
jgi:hypothetical protein